jgi:LL-H family phage holin
MNDQVILALIPYVVPSVIALLVYFYHQTFQRIPQKQRDALEQLATPIVQMVEQVYKNATPEEKKAAALHAIDLAFKAFNIPEPDSAIINTFIESAVYELNRLQPNINPLPAPAQGSAS